MKIELPLYKELRNGGTLFTISTPRDDCFHEVLRYLAWTELILNILQEEVQEFITVYDVVECM